jgi:cellulose synthase operon protein C
MPKPTAPTPWLPAKLAATTAACFVLLACSQTSDADLLASAKQYLAKNDRPAAIIQLKSALQQNVNSAEARFLLGKALFDGGDFVAASVELRKAADLKYDESAIAPLLAQTLLQQGETRRVLESYGSTTLDDASANASLQTSVARAHAMLDQRAEAEKSLAAALASDAKFVPALLLQARIAASKQDFTGALKILDDITTQSPGEAEAWVFKGELQQGALNDKPAALAAYRKAVELRNDYVGAHQAIVALLVGDGQLDAARAHVEALKKTLPDQPGTKLMEAQMAYLAQDYAATREITTPLLQLAPNNPLLLQLAGAAEFRLGAMPKAENLLAQAVKLNPGMPMASQLLSRIYLRGGQPDKALELLKPELASEQPRAEALLLAGEAFLQSGDAPRAEALFARAAQQQPGNARARTAVALTQIGKGETAAGMAALESLSSADEGATADLALIASHLRNRNLPKALAAIDTLAKKQPKNPLAPNLRGRLQVAQGNVAGARKSFEEALALDGSYFPAVVSLTALDMTEKKPDAARQRLEAVVQAEPTNHRALMALAALAARNGGSAAEVTALIERAVRAKPDEVTPRLQLVEHHLASGNPKAALDVAQQANTDLPNQRELVQALGRAQLANSDWQQALTSFNRLGTLQPNSSVPPMGLAQAHLGLKAYDAAEREYKRALGLTPNLLSAQRGLIELYAGEGNYTDALALAREIQKQRPQAVLGLHLEGDLEQQRRKWDAALAAYRSALQKSKSAESAMKVHSTLIRAERAEEAQRFAQQWQKDQPNDAAFRYYLGDLALSRSDWVDAEARYREVLRLQPENALALNNVAWLLVKQGKPGALALAEKATTLMPSQLPLMDTLALALASEKQLDKALAMQRQTLQRAPENPALRLTMARLLLQSGDKAKARSELEDLAKLGKGFAEHADVTELLQRASS